MIPATRKAWTVADPYTGQDRFAGDCALTALLSDADPLSIEEICDGIRCPMPVSAEDLESLALVCKVWKIRCILDDEPPVYDEVGGGNWSYFQRDR